MVAAAFHHVPAKELGDLDHPIESDVLVCSDHPTATEATVEIVAQDPRHAARSTPASCRNAAPIEAFAAVLLQLNVQLQDPGRRCSFTGIPTS